MTYTPYKTVLNGKLNKTYLLQCLKTNLLFNGPFRFAYTPTGWKCFTKFDTVTSDLNKALETTFETAMNTTLATAKKQIKAQCKNNGDKIAALENEAYKWGLMVFSAFKQGTYTPFTVKPADLMKRTDCYNCHIVPIADYSKKPWTAKTKLVKVPEIKQAANPASPLFAFGKPKKEA